MTNLEKLTELQNKIGYVNGQVHPVAMLGLMGEAGEVAQAATFITPKAKSLMQRDFFKFEAMVGHFVGVAGEIDDFKKKLRSKTENEIHFAIKPDEEDFDPELADLFYYLNAVAIGRGLTIDDLARMSYEKVIARRGVVNDGDPAR